MIGILCEKPSAAKNFAKALGGMKGAYNNEAYVITNTIGHLYELASPEKQVPANLSEQYHKWDLANLPWDESVFKWDRVKKSTAASVLPNIKAVLSTCDEIVIATDVDESGEGDLLAWEILDELKMRPKRFSRMHFADEAPKSIQKAFVARKTIPSMANDPAYIKSMYRSQWDFLSMQFTRIATKCGDGRSVLRQGRLKSVMVSITGDGLAALAAYKKVPFYSNKFRDNNGNVFTNPKEPIFPKKGQVPASYQTSPVIIDSKTMKRTAPPKLLDLAGLSSILSSKGVKARDVLAVYQKMYEQQIVSYPRTDDKQVTPEQFDELLPLIDKIAGVVGINTSALTHRGPRKTHVKVGGAHGANRPGVNVPASLDALKTFGTCAPLIYTVLAKNYLSILAEDYEYEAQKGHLERYPDFTGTSSIPKKMGFKDIFSDADDDASNTDDTGKGLGTTADPFIHEGFPPKPPVPTMKWLVGPGGQLEKHNVGSGATRTGTYADVTNEKAKYPLLVDKKGKLTMSPFGEMSYLLLKNTNIGNVSTTEMLQQQMKDIEAGKFNPAKGLHDLQQLVRDDLEIMKQNGNQLRKVKGVKMEAQEQKEKCEGLWNGKNIAFNRTWGGHRFTDSECEALCNGKTIEVFDLISKAGKPYGITGKLTNQTYKDKPFVGFERTGFANRPGVPSSWCKHTFTKDESLMLEAGKPIDLTGCVSNKGNTFACKVTYGKQDNGSMGIIPQFG